MKQIPSAVRTAILLLPLLLSAACGKEAVAKGAHAGNLVKAAAVIAGGNGGGRPDSAMAGGKDSSKIEEALASAGATLSAQLK